MVVSIPAGTIHDGIANIHGDHCIMRKEFLDRAQKALEYRLFDAGRDADTEIAKEVIQQGLDEGAWLNRKNKDGKTLIHTACANGHFSIVRPLLEHGASLHITDNDGNTPLDYATKLSSEYERINTL